MTKKRILEVELMKAIAIIGMVYIHVFETSDFIGTITSGPEYTVGVILDFFGGIISGGAFMFAMGWGAAFSDRSTPEVHLKRCIKLFLLGLLVNVFQQWFPMIIDPEDFGELSEQWYSILAVDVYAFASMIMLYFALMKKLAAHRKLCMAISVGLLIITLLVNTFVEPEGYSTGYGWADTVIGLFVRENEYSYFPLVSWFMFPLMGFGAGILYRKWEDPKKFNILLGVTGIIALVGGSVVMLLIDMPNAVLNPFPVTDTEYYALSTLNIITGCGLIAVEYVAASLIMKLTKNKLPEFLANMSRYVMHIYISQWLLIGLLSGFISEVVHIVPIILIATGVLIAAYLYSVVLTKLLLKHRKKKQENNSSQGQV